MRNKILDNLAVLERERERGDMMEKEKRNATPDNANFLFTRFAKSRDRRVKKQHCYGRLAAISQLSLCSNAQMKTMSRKT